MSSNHTPPSSPFPDQSDKSPSEWLGSDGLYSVAVLQCNSLVQQSLERNVLAIQQGLGIQFTTTTWDGILSTPPPEARQGEESDYGETETQGPAEGSGPERRPALPNFTTEEAEAEPGEQEGGGSQYGISGGPPGGPFGPGRVRPVEADGGDPYEPDEIARPAATRPQAPVAPAAAPRSLTVKKGLLFVIGLSFSALL